MYAARQNGAIWLVLLALALVPPLDAAAHEAWNSNDFPECQQEGTACQKFLLHANRYIFNEWNERFDGSEKSIEAWAGALGTLWHHQWLLALQVQDKTTSETRVQVLKKIRKDLETFIQVVAHDVGFHQRDDDFPELYKYPGLRPDSPSRVDDAWKAFNAASSGNNWWFEPPAMEPDRNLRSRRSLVNQFANLRTSTQGASYSIPSMFEGIVERPEGYLQLHADWAKTEGKDTLRTMSIRYEPCTSPEFSELFKDLGGRLSGPCYLARITRANINWLTNTKDKEVKHINDVWIRLVFTGKLESIRNNDRYYLYIGEHTDSQKSRNKFYMRADGARLGMVDNKGKYHESFQRKN